MKKVLLWITLLSLLFSAAALPALAVNGVDLPLAMKPDSESFTWISTKKFSFDCSYTNYHAYKTVDSFYLLYVALDSAENVLVEEIQEIDVNIRPGETKAIPRVYVEDYQKAKYFLCAIPMIYYTDGTMDYVDVDADEEMDFYATTLLR